MSDETNDVLKQLNDYIDGNDDAKPDFSMMRNIRDEVKRLREDNAYLRKIIDIQGTFCTENLSQEAQAELTQALSGEEKK